MMKRIIPVWIVILSVAGMVLHSDSPKITDAGGIGYFEGGDDSSYNLTRADSNPVPCIFYDETSFLDAVAAASSYQNDISGLKGGVVPHHLLASRMIASFWKTVSKADYDLIVLIGPDHQKRGCSDITTITSPFSTIYGDVEVDRELALSLINDNLAAEDLSVMENEYAITAQIPFIKYYMQDTKVLPLLVYGNCGVDKLDALSDAILDSTAGRNILVVASMDFSHYLPMEEADRMDIITEDALTGFDYDKILGMTNDNLDSRPSILFLLRTMAASNSRFPVKWAHSNSDIIGNTLSGNTTSYFNFGFFSREPGQEIAVVQDTQNAGDAPSSELHITAVGDIMLGRGVSQRLKSQGLDYIYPFIKTEDLFKKGDIVFGNLEQPITDRVESLDGEHKYVLKSGTEAYSGIAFAGFNLLSLANNHMMDYYDNGLFDTMKILQENGVAFAGAGKNKEEARALAVININDLKVGLLAYTDMADIYYEGDPSIGFAAGEQTPGVASRNPEWVMEDIRKAREQVDLLIVSLHWGTEDSFSVTDEQVRFAHELIDQGADMILGHHPHRFQGIEIYKGKPIIYSLGNFIFDQNDPENQESFILNFTYSKTMLTELRAIPVRTVDKIQVVPQEGPDAKTMLERELQLSNDLDTQFSILDDSLVYIIK